MYSTIKRESINIKYYFKYHFEFIICFLSLCKHVTLNKLALKGYNFSKNFNINLGSMV